PARCAPLPYTTLFRSAVGFCLGGLLAYLTATRTDADASVSYYGVGIENFTAEGANLARPLLMHIAEEDQFVSKEAQAKIKADLGDRKSTRLNSSHVKI